MTVCDYSGILSLTMRENYEGWNLFGGILGSICDGFQLILCIRIKKGIPLKRSLRFSKN